MASTAQEALQLAVKGKGVTKNSSPEEPEWKSLTQQHRSATGRSLQDLTKAARRDAAEYWEKMEHQVGEITIVAAQEAEDLRKALQKEKEKRQKMVSDIVYLAENLEDIPMRQLRIQLMAIKGDEDMPYPQQIRRHPPTSPSVLPFVNAATQTDDEVELVDRDLSDEGPNRVTAAEETHFKYKNMGGFSFPPLHDSAVNASSSDTSLLDGPNTKKLPPLHTPNTTYPSESSSTASLVEAKAKKHAKKSTRRGRR